MRNSFAIEATGLAKSYGKHGVFKNLDLTVEEGSIFALLGPNGAGKTTTVRILSTLTKADKGAVRVAGLELATDIKAIRSKISLTGQYAAVDEKLTGKENMHMIGELCGLPRKETKRRTQELLGLFDLQSAADTLSSTYSGGMRRKLDLAMSLINSPEIIFLDEPTTGLDPRSRKSMWEIIAKLRDEGVTIFLTTQYLEEADQLADTVAVIDGGVIVAKGTPDELKRRVGDRSLQLQFATENEAIMASKLFAKEDILSVKNVTLSIKTDGSVKSMKRIVDALAHANATPQDMAFHTPSLDEVFFALTGNHNQHKEANDEN